MNKKLLLIGSGGHFNSCIDIIEKNKKFNIIGCVSNKTNNKLDKYKIIGSDNDLPELRNKFHNAFICIGQIKDLKLREKIYKKLVGLNFNIPNFVSNSAIVSKKTLIKKGTIIMNNSVINRNAIVEENCIINTNSIIEHDSLICKHTHISTGVIINGGSIIENNCFIGSGSIIREGIKIGSNSFIGAGSLIKNDIKKNSIIK